MHPRHHASKCASARAPCSQRSASQAGRNERSTTWGWKCSTWWKNSRQTSSESQAASGVSCDYTASGQAAKHVEPPSSEATDWPQIAALYRILGEMQPSPVVELNRAVAIAMADGPAARLALVELVAAGGQLGDYPYLHSTRADLLRRLGRRAEAAR